MQEAVAELERIRKEEMPAMRLGDATPYLQHRWKAAIEAYNMLDIGRGEFESRAQCAVKAEATAIVRNSLRKIQPTGRATLSRGT